MAVLFWWILAFGHSLFSGMRHPIAGGHWDLGADIRWNDPADPQSGGEWEFFLYDYAAQQRLALDDFVFVVDRRYQGTIPSGGSWSQVLGPAGADRWTLPFTQQPEQIFLGFRIFPQPQGIMRGRNAADSNGWVTLSLDSVSGSGRNSGGEFAVYEITGVATSPDINSGLLSSLLPNREIGLPVTSGSATHTHYYWDMTAPGRYEVDIALTSNLRSTGEPINGVGRIVFKVIGDEIGPPSGFGALHLDEFPWVYHAQFGWLYWKSHAANEGWFIDPNGMPHYWIQSKGHLWVLDALGTGEWGYGF